MTGKNAQGGGGGDKKVAVEFEKIIHEDRDRKKNEALAARIFSKDRRSSAPSNLQSQPQPTGGSLASRAGVQKNTNATNPPKNKKSRGTWPSHPSGSGSRPASLASRITDSTAVPQRQKRRAAQVAEAMIRTELHTGRAEPLAAPTQGLMIRGLAGPVVVVAENFVEGTTAADIDSALASTGGAVERIVLTKTKPFVVAEIVFASKEGGDRVVTRFNGLTADGRVLAVYRKAINSLTPDHLLPPQKRYPPPAPGGPRHHTDDPVLIDGRMGFDDPMDMDNIAPRYAPRGPAAEDGSGLYSDDVIRTNRRGRGFGAARPHY